MVKEIPLENPPETPVSAQEISSPEDASMYTRIDQPNGVAATEEMTKQTEESGSEVTPVSQQEATADPAGDLVSEPVPEESVPSAEVPTEEVQSQEPMVDVEELAGEEAKQISVEEKPSREEPETVAENIPDDPKPSAPEDVSVNSEDGNPALNAAQEEVLPGDVNINVAAQEEILDDKEPVIRLSKAVQSKGTSKCEGPPISTCHLSGWFQQQRRLPPRPNFLYTVSWTHILVGWDIFFDFDIFSTQQHGPSCPFFCLCSSGFVRVGHDFFRFFSCWNLP